MHIQLHVNTFTRTHILTAENCFSSRTGFGFLINFIQFFVICQRVYFNIHTTSCVELKRLQSSLSVSNSKVKIPVRIQRGPTDILEALEQTIPKDSITNNNYLYHDDPYLLPLKKRNYRAYALSYEAGKKAAKWIHNEHKDLFPKHLSEPEIEAFIPPSTYTDKSQVSEEILLRIIYRRIVPEALHVYKLLDHNVSNDTKQILLELLCFYNSGTNSQNISRLEEWFTLSYDKYAWQYMSEINELFEFLKMQDSSTAAVAYNTMICGLAKHSRVNEAWILYHECKEKNILLNITTCNYLLALIPETFGYKHELKMERFFDILDTINKKRIKPNIKTLNAALHVIVVAQLKNDEDIAQRLFMDFKRMNIEFSPATYYYMILIFTQKHNENAYANFVNILHSIRNKSFSIQDLLDDKFFKHAMYLADSYYDREAGDMIHKLLLIRDNYKFISRASIENSYYISYISLVLSTSTVDDFFEFYEKLVPNIFVPPRRIFEAIVKHLEHYKEKIQMKHLQRLWLDISTLCFTNFSLKLRVLSLVEMDALPADSPFKTFFMDAAWTCWNEIQTEIETKSGTYTPLENAKTACIVAILLHGGHIVESIEVLTYITKESDLFLPTMNEIQVNELFESYISKECILGAFLVLEYSVNSGFPHIIKMATTLQNLPQLTDAYRKELINLVGAEALNSSDTEQSN
ncbi:protein PTCD3 homolog, mitochondrial isoform X3 [Bombus terrestris]|uniref:Small ribosomal subunit protein mS39 n=1 Tax=Bombus terrestris TaxID=30195 RepID=A0A9C6WA06_BOMTE|nr:protein PTCD3 homolog, mitochondrial isoform X3 [Bombus terrestris]